MAPQIERAPTLRRSSQIRSTRVQESYSADSREWGFVPRENVTGRAFVIFWSKTQRPGNWQAHGAKGPFRVSPNLMVVVPTQRDVSLTYGLTGVDWLGRFVTLLGIAGLVLLGLWKGARKYAADAESSPTTPDDSDGESGGGGPGDDGVVPPDRSQPAPALP